LGRLLGWLWLLGRGRLPRRGLARRILRLGRRLLGWLLLGILSVTLLLPLTLWRIPLPWLPRRQLLAWRRGLILAT